MGPSQLIYHMVHYNMHPDCMQCETLIMRQESRAQTPSYDRGPGFLPQYIRLFQRSRFFFIMQRLNFKRLQAYLSADSRAWQ